MQAGFAEVGIGGRDKDHLRYWAVADHEIGTVFYYEPDITEKQWQQDTKAPQAEYVIVADNEDVYVSLAPDLWKRNHADGSWTHISSDVDYIGTGSNDVVWVSNEANTKVGLSHGDGAITYFNGPPPT